MSFEYHPYQCDILIHWQEIALLAPSKLLCCSFVTVRAPKRWNAHIMVDSYLIISYSCRRIPPAISAGQCSEWYQLQR